MSPALAFTDMRKRVLFYLILGGFISAAFFAANPFASALDQRAGLRHKTIEIAAFDARHAETRMRRILKANRMDDEITQAHWAMVEKCSDTANPMISQCLIVFKQ